MKTGLFGQLRTAAQQRQTYSHRSLPPFIYGRPRPLRELSTAAAKSALWSTISSKTVFVAKFQTNRTPKLLTLASKPTYHIKHHINLYQSAIFTTYENILNYFKNQLKHNLRLSWKQVHTTKSIIFIPSNLLIIIRLYIHNNHHFFNAYVPSAKQ